MVGILVHHVERFTVTEHATLEPFLTSPQVIRDAIRTYHEVMEKMDQKDAETRPSGPTVRDPLQQILSC